MRADATPLVVGQIRGVSFALHSAERRPPSRPASSFQTVSLGTRVNKAASVLALGAMCQKKAHLRNALVYTDRRMFGARERKYEIVGTIAEPRTQRRNS